MPFPKNFLWGVATSAGQIEGGWNEGGRGESIWDVFCHEPGKIKEDATGDVACDHYHRFREDIALFGEMGFKMFRMSINWTRLYPTGLELEPNEAGVQFYHNVFDELHKYGIEPLVTLCHYETPLGLTNAWNSWADRRTIECFERYAKTCFAEYGSKVKYWLTFNEINVIQMGGFMAAGLGYTTPQIVADAIKNQFLGSARAVQILHGIDPENMVGNMVAYGATYPNTCHPDDVLK